MNRLFEWLDAESGAVETWTSALIAALVILAGICAGIRLVGD